MHVQMRVAEQTQSRCACSWKSTKHRWTLQDTVIETATVGICQDSILGGSKKGYNLDGMSLIEVEELKFTDYRFGRYNKDGG